MDMNLDVSMADIYEMIDSLKYMINETQDSDINDRGSLLGQTLFDLFSASISRPEYIAVGKILALQLYLDVQNQDYFINSWDTCMSKTQLRGEPYKDHRTQKECFRSAIQGQLSQASDNQLELIAKILSIDSLLFK